ncbi:unnamed protein product [Cylicocyclus nassatus]|uniref:Cystinosin n=1 Tax=Cylicocyclus nassatus TaxID=53992 RepID=A0AA36GV42_CYLNA|nr:unnamed protein product [Cylicocyclus nassatus]
MVVISLGSPLSTSSLQPIVRPEKLTVTLGKSTNFTLRIKMTLKNDVELYFIGNPYVVVKPLLFKATTCEGVFHVHGRRPSNGHRLEIRSCATPSSNVGNSECDIIVIGLNFDLLALNVLGYLTYFVYNLFMFASEKIQAQYHEAHPHSPIPVLLNDVFFAFHGLATCLATVGQCFVYKRGGQRVSLICIVIMVILSLYALVSGLAMACGYLNMLQFVTNLSFIKMAVTPLKYIPQAILNYRRKSTTGWSIGNRLLDFAGGGLGLLQMGLQCWNVADWTAFYGNPVKFGLSLVSLLFDILFMIQHYILYPQKRRKDRSSEGEEKNTDESNKSHEKSDSTSTKERTTKNRKDSHEKSDVRQKENGAQEKEQMDERGDKSDAGQSLMMILSAI